MGQLAVQPDAQQADAAGYHKNQDGGGEVAGNQRSPRKGRAEQRRQTRNGGDGKEAQGTNLKQTCRQSQQSL